MKKITILLAVLLLGTILFSCTNAVIQPTQEARSAAIAAFESGSTQQGYYFDTDGVWDYKGHNETLRFRYYSLWYNPSNLPSPAELSVESGSEGSYIVRGDTRYQLDPK